DDYYRHLLIGIPSRIRIKKIFQELGNIRGKKLLDIGCEAGYITLKLAQKGAIVTAIDLIQEPLQELRRRLKNKNLKISLRVADAADLPFKTNSFALILATEVIEHISRLERFVTETNRVLNPGGRLLITFPNENLRQKLYPFVSLFGIKAEVETQVTLKKYRAEEIIKLFSRKFTLTKHYLLPWWCPITHLMIFAPKQ
ncbi:MAG: class I SAM-dependent methyltransferase, partial [Patescibacteria group bacterium]|nr:class I SAM-dependent methyltransferase [Patescibacteria group bacterium]